MNHVLDASSLINLSNGGILQGVLQLQDATCYVSPIVMGECEGSDDVGREVSQAVSSASLLTFSDSEIPATTFLTLLEAHRMGLGETECLTIAIIHGFVFCSDDLKARKVAILSIGEDHVTGSLGLARRLVKAGLLSSEAAFQAYAKMVERGAFLPTITEQYFKS